MKRIRLKLAERSYDILIGQLGFSELIHNIKRLNIGNDAFVISNPTIFRLYGSKLRQGFYRKGFGFKAVLVEDKETAKSWAVAFRLLQQITKFDRLKRVFIVAFGGGVVGDLAGFVAAIYKRGIPYIQIPTTLLSQVDSAIGGKVAIDLPVAKNIIGSFYQPKIVFSDLSFLETLPRREMISGLSEVIKYGMIKDRRLFEFIERNYKKILNKDKRALEYIIYASSLIKTEVVEHDEFDRKNKRVILNFGHTIGHAIEASTNYSGRYGHGEAISIGMVYACFVAERLGLIKPTIRMRLEKLLMDVGLPIRLKEIQLSSIYTAYEHDKKFIHGFNRLVLPIQIGKVVIKERVPKRIILSALMDIIKDEQQKQETSS